MDTVRTVKTRSSVSRTNFLIRLAMGHSMRSIWLPIATALVQDLMSMKILWC